MTAPSRFHMRTLTLVTGITVFAAMIGVDPGGANLLVSRAEARIGRPLTPLSYAGVARRTTFRAGVYGAYYGAAAANATAAHAASHTATYPEGTVVYAAPPGGCAKIVYPDGVVVYRCP